MKYNFYYDETEHSHIINYQTITADNFYDNFITVIVGWRETDEKYIFEKYKGFEEKYFRRMKDGELKSQTMKKKDFKSGFSSLNKNTIGFYEDFLSIFDEKIIIYFSVSNKIEYVIHQIFRNYNNSFFADIDLMKYSITKAILVYRPQKVIEAIYKSPNDFINELKVFLEDRIEKNKNYIPLKGRENEMFKQILLLLGEAEAPERFDWNYYPAFDGFKKLLVEMGITDYSLTTDMDGDEHKTLNAARDTGIEYVCEGDSKDYFGIRMADMFAGLISKLMQSLNEQLIGNYKNEKIDKKLLGIEWFSLNQRQLELYKRLHDIIFIYNDYWYRTYAGLYTDDLIAFLSLLSFMDRFSKGKDTEEFKIEMQPEYYNTYVCEQLKKHYEDMGNKLPIEFVTNDYEDYFLNQRGAKVYKDINRQKMLPIKAGKNIYEVLSVGLSKELLPLVTISENGEPICYRLPEAYSDWAMTVVGFANRGENFFPETVVCSCVDGKFFADIL